MEAERGCRAALPTEFIQYPKGQRAYAIDWNNFAPNLGATFRPTFDRGLLHAVFGSEPVFRAGFAMAYSRNGMSDFTDYFGQNPGIQIDATRSYDLGNLGTAPGWLGTRHPVPGPITR